MGGRCFGAHHLTYQINRSSKGKLQIKPALHLLETEIYKLHCMVQVCMFYTEAARCLLLVMLPPITVLTESGRLLRKTERRGKVICQ